MDISIELTSRFTNEEVDQLRLFTFRVDQIYDNWLSLQKAGISLGGSFTNLGDGKVAGESCGVEIHRLKGLYLDYRFFHADKEPTHFYKILKLIGSHCKDDRFYEFSKSCKKSWNQEGFLNCWHGFTTDQIINAYFNGRFFHSGSDQINPIALISKTMNDDLVNHQLVYGIFNRIKVVRSLSSAVSPIYASQKYLKVKGEWLAQQS